MRNRWRRLLLLTVLAAGLTQPAVADELPQLHIRARSRLLLREVERRRAPDGYRLTVAIVLGDSDDSAAAPAAGDDATRPFASQPVELALQSLDPDSRDRWRPLTVLTGPGGAASQRFSGLPLGRYQLVAHYRGDADREPGEARLLLDLDRRPAELSLDLPPTLGLHEALAVAVGLRAGGQPLDAAVELQLGSQPPQSLTLSGGRQRTIVKLRPEPAAGVKLRVTVRYAGDADTAPAAVSQELLITTQAQLSLALRPSRPPTGKRRFFASPPSTLPTEVAQASRVVLYGSVSDEAGPIGGELVEVEASGPGERRLLGSGLTDFFGNFEIPVEPLPLAVGPSFLTARLTAELTPRHRHVQPGHSAELPLTVLPPEPLPLLYFVLPLLLSGLGGLLWRGGSAVGRRLRRWWVTRRPTARAKGGSPLAATSADSPVITGDAGVVLGSKSQRSSLTLRRTVDATIDGAIHDAVFGPPVSGASVHLLPLKSGAQIEPATVDSQGQFRFSQLLPGRYVVRASAPGFLPEEFAATIPHRGELRGVTVRLMPLRARIHAEWQRVASAWYPGDTQLPSRTPRELLQAAEQPPAGSPPPPSPLPPPTAATLDRLRRLTALVEQSYYSQKLGTLDMLGEAEQLATALLTPTTAADPPPTAPSRPPGPPPPSPQ